MPYTIIWTAPAESDFLQIVQYLAERSLQGAASVSQAILKQIEMLGHFPLIGALYPDAVGREIREAICRNYRIFYRVHETEKSVYVLRVWHRSRSEPESME